MKKLFILLSIGSILSLVTLEVHAEENDKYQVEVDLSIQKPNQLKTLMNLEMTFYCLLNQ